MKILFVAEVGSIHSARWVNQLKDTGWDIHLCQGAALSTGVAPELECGTIHLPFSPPVPVEAVRGGRSGLRYFVDRVAFRLPPTAAFMRWRHAVHVTELIRQLRPDVVHSLGLNVNWNNLTLPVLRARKVLDAEFTAPWVYSSWGTDLDYYARMSSGHEAEARQLLASCDYYISECDRDIRLASQFGFTGEVLGKMPAFGGVDAEGLRALQAVGPVSSRRLIYLKGRDQAGGGDPVGRATTAMKAFDLCRAELHGYKIVVGQASPVVAAEVERLSQTGMDIELLPRLPYKELLRTVGASRVSIALTVNDGLPGHLVEALALGALPLHSDVESIAEWVEDGVNGLLVGAEDVEGVAAALKRALADDGLVDNGAAVSARRVEAELSDAVVRPRAIDMYRQVAEKGPVRR